MPGSMRRSSPPRRTFSTATALFRPLQNRTGEAAGRPGQFRPRFRLRHRPQHAVPARGLPKADIVGCDPSAESLVIARENPSCGFTSMDELGTDAKFDLVIASCVFHHIPPQDRQMAIRYCNSRLKEGGHFLIFEHNPINPVTRHLVKNCPFDADAVLLSMRETIERMRNAHLEIDESSYCLFFPQQLAALRPFEKYLRWLPIGGQYFVCASGPNRNTVRAA